MSALQPPKNPSGQITGCEHGEQRANGEQPWTQQKAGQQAHAGKKGVLNSFRERIACHGFEPPVWGYSGKDPRRLGWQTASTLMAANRIIANMR